MVFKLIENDNLMRILSDPCGLLMTSRHVLCIFRSVCELFP